MIVVSNEKINDLSLKSMSYDDFKIQAFSDEGLTIEGIIMININELSKDVFEAAKDQEEIKFFTLTGNTPSFCDKPVENWEDKKVIKPEENWGDQKIIKTEENLGSIKNESNGDIQEAISNLLDQAETDYDPPISKKQQKESKIYVFGSSKGGTGKTFTSIISTYRYAKTHPNERIALVDFDIIDGQIGISIHKIKPTMRNYVSEYQKGYKDFNTMSRYAIKANNPFPNNVDFYLAPSNGNVINNDAFWINIISNCMENYDVVVFDTGIDYLNIKPISYVYKIADKINLVTTTSIKSVNSITKQISKLKGETKNSVFSKEDDVFPRLNIIITQMVDTDEMNKTIYSTLLKKCNIIATFGVITQFVSQAEFYGKWDVFDKNLGICKSLDDIMS